MVRTILREYPDRSYTNKNALRYHIRALLKKYPVGTQCYHTAINVAGLWVKTKTGIRVASDKAHKKYWAKKTEREARAYARALERMTIAPQFDKTPKRPEPVDDELFDSGLTLGCGQPADEPVSSNIKKEYTAIVNASFTVLAFDMDEAHEIAEKRIKIIQSGMDLELEEIQ